MTSSRKNKEGITSVLGKLFPSYLYMKKNYGKAKAHLEGADPLLLTFKIIRNSVIMLTFHINYLKTCIAMTSLSIIVDITFNEILPKFNDT